MKMMVIMSRPQIFRRLHSSNEDVITGGPYQDDLDQTLVTEEFCLSEACYTFTIEDQFGDGICCGFGDGSYELKNQNNVTLAAGGEFTNSESEDFCASFTSISDVKTEEIRVYPNPTNSEISFNSTETINSIEIYDVSGRLVESITLNINGNIVLDVSSLSSGSYFLMALKENGAVRSAFVKK